MKIKIIFYFSYKGNPLKKCEFPPPKKNLFLIKKIEKYSLCQNFIVLCVEMTEIAIKSVKMQILNISLSYIQIYTVCFNSKFQAILMFDG